MRFASLSIIALVLFAAIAAAAGPQPVQREVYAMGTMLRIVLYEQDSEKAYRQMEDLIRSVEETEAQLSNWKPESELSRLNALPAGQTFAASASLCKLMVTLQGFVTRTGGAFDPSVGLLLQTWGIHHEVRVPEAKEIATALQNTGFQYYSVDLEHNTIVKSKALVTDSGAFGKGEALDRAIAIAREEQMGPLLMNFGGQVAVWGKPPDQEQWLINLSDPENRSRPLPAQVKIRGGSISTSGGAEKDVVLHGKIIGHHLDPHTGYPVPSFGSVTVWAPTALQADILSTALYVMGPQKGRIWAEKADVAACFLLKPDGSLSIQTVDFKRLN
jgi:FAD:protein FMN transferase